VAESQEEKDEQMRQAMAETQEENQRKAEQAQAEREAYEESQEEDDAGGAEELPEQEVSGEKPEDEEGEKKEGGLKYGDDEDDAPGSLAIDNEFQGDDPNAAAKTNEYTGEEDYIKNMTGGENSSRPMVQDENGQWKSQFDKGEGKGKSEGKAQGGKGKGVKKGGNQGGGGGGQGIRLLKTVWTHPKMPHKAKIKITKAIAKLCQAIPYAGPIIKVIAIAKPDILEKMVQFIIVTVDSWTPDRGFMGFGLTPVSSGAIWLKPIPVPPFVEPINRGKLVRKPIDMMLKTPPIAPILKKLKKVLDTAEPAAIEKALDPILKMLPK